MGFMDKAKKLAEQAQTKLDEVQKDFNAKQGTGGDAHAGPGNAVEYDEHGRAKTPETPQTPGDLPATGSGELDKAVGDPLTAEPTAPAAAPTPEPADEPRATPTQGDPLLEESEKKSPPAPGGGLTSGDPLG